MDASPLILGAYLLGKALAYVGWCRLGLRWLAPEARRPGLRALGLGLLRMAMGALFGVGIFLASAAVYSALGAGIQATRGSSMVLTYLSTYVPVRWIEWGLIELLLHRRARSPGGFLLGGGARARGWRLGGIALSCLADVPMILSIGGLPLGRFMC